MMEGMGRSKKKKALQVTIQGGVVGGGSEQALAEIDSEN